MTGPRRLRYSAAMPRRARQAPGGYIFHVPWLGFVLLNLCTGVWRGSRRLPAGRSPTRRRRLAGQQARFGFLLVQQPPRSNRWLLQRALRQGKRDNAAAGRTTNSPPVIVTQHKA